METKKSLLDKAMEDAIAGLITSEQFDAIMKAEANKRSTDKTETTDTKTKDDLLNSISDFRKNVLAKNKEKGKVLTELMERMKVIYEGTITYNNRPVKVKAIASGEIVIEFSDAEHQKQFYSEIIKNNK